MKQSAQKLIPDHLQGKEMLEWLELHCDGKESGKYFRKFTEDEMISAREQYTDQSITFHNDSENVKEEIKSLKDQIKSQQARLKMLLDSISIGGTNEDGLTFLIKDFDERKVYKYDHNGQMVGVRSMLPEERQISMQVTKTK